MVWLKKFPWLSLGILLVTYGVFGWIFTQSSLVWSQWLIGQGQAWGWSLREDWIFIDIHLLAIAIIVLVTLALTAPITLLTTFIGHSLKSDAKAFISMLMWSLAFSIILCWFVYFVRLLVLLAAAMLARLELRTKGYNEGQTFILLILFCLGGFVLGVFSFYRLPITNS
ncbi:MAG: hypothetical protein ACREPR_03480 [Brasilonema sp.]